MNPLLIYILFCVGTVLFIFLNTNTFWMWVYRHMDRYKRLFADIEEFRALGETYGCNFPVKVFHRKAFEINLRQFDPTGNTTPDMYININVYADGIKGYDKEELKRACHILAARHLCSRGFEKITVTQYAKTRTITRAELEAVLAGSQARP